MNAQNVLQESGAVVLAKQTDGEKETTDERVRGAHMTNKRKQTKHCVRSFSFAYGCQNTSI